MHTKLWQPYLFEKSRFGKGLKVVTRIKNVLINTMKSPTTFTGDIVLSSCVGKFFNSFRRRRKNWPRLNVFIPIKKTETTLRDIHIAFYTYMTLLRHEECSKLYKRQSESAIRKQMDRQKYFPLMLVFYFIVFPKKNWRTWVSKLFRIPEIMDFQKDIFYWRYATLHRYWKLSDVFNTNMNCKPLNS